MASARRLTRRSVREAERLFLAEGPQAVREALRVESATAVRRIFATSEAVDRHADVVVLAASSQVSIDIVPAKALRELSGTVTPQGLVAVCSFFDVSLDVALASRPALVAVLVQARDPGNAGTVVRTADAAGAGAVVLTDGSVDVYNGKCVRASAGSVFHLPVSVGASLGTTVTALRASGLQILAADGSGELDLDTAASAGRLVSPTAWLFGNEAWGLPEKVRDMADAVLRVPIYGRAESLNLATAAAVCLYASAQRQRSG